MRNEAAQSPSGYYAWYDREASARAKADEVLKARFRSIYGASRGTYGCASNPLRAAGGGGRSRARGEHIELQISELEEVCILPIEHYRPKNRSAAEDQHAALREFFGRTKN